ncbi:MAG TPA: nuclear transport factor 2 family protein [Fimbriimonas sp.]
MKTTSSLLVLAVLSVSAISSAQSERSSDRAQAIALFHRADSLFNSGRYNAYFSLFTPGFYQVDADGNRIHKARFKAAAMSALDGVQNARMKNTIKNVQLTDNELMVWVEERLSYRTGRGPMVLTSRYAYNLVRAPGGWAFASAQQLPTNEPWSFKTN